MIKNFLIGILCMSLFTYTMEIPKKITTKNESFGRIVHASGVKQIAFVGDYEVIFDNETSFCIFNFADNSTSSALENYNAIDGWQLTTDISKHRALLWRSYRDNSEIVVYDSRSKEIRSDSIELNPKVNKQWKCCFDESKSNSVLVKRGEPTEIISYNYMTKKIDPDAIASLIFKKNVDIDHCTFDVSSKTRKFFCKKSRERIIFEEGESGLLEFRYSTEERDFEHHLLCATDNSFIAGYSQSSPFTCYIFDLQSSRKKCLIHTDKEEHGAECPCAMEISPDNKVLVTMFAGYRDVRFWVVTTTECIEKFSNSSIENNPDNAYIQEIGTFKESLSFSSNGRYLAAAYPKYCIIFDVPLHVRWARSKKNLVFVWWFLRNCQLLPKELVDSVLNSL